MKRPAGIRVALLSLLAHLAAGISLFNPTTDVVQGTFIDCQWNAVSSDPATFTLVMQFFNGTADFGDNAVFTIVRRANTTTGMVNDIKNVGDLGPYDPTTQPLALAPAFQVVPYSMSASASNPAAPSVFASAPTSTQGTDGFTPTRFFSSIPSPASQNRTPIIVGATIGCAALALGILGTAVLIVRGRNTRTLDLLRGRPFPPVDPEPVNLYGHRAVFDAPTGSIVGSSIVSPVSTHEQRAVFKTPTGSSSGSSSEQVVAQGRENAELELQALRAEIDRLRLEQNALPPSYRLV
ncbi:hypothetical protein C8R45DRAFT_1114432 [Mycena sanguinolenta]|nr:hypothetical protein C8R45DRAFT_1114432 [Mycena sanguinolenta]